MNCRKCAKEIPEASVFCAWCGAKQALKERRRKPKTRANGEGTAFYSGRSWHAQVTIGKTVEMREGVPRYKLIRATKGGFAKKTEALAYCKTLKQEAQAAGRRSNRLQMTMRQIYDAWTPTHETTVSRSTMGCYRAAWNHFAPLHDLPFNEIELDDLQECVDECGRGKRTKEDMKALAGLLYKYALPRHQTDMNYADFISTGSDKKGTHPAFTPEQVEQIRALVGKTPHADYVYAMIYTGLRTAEFVGLRKEDYIDGVLYCGIKTEAGRDRAVPVSSRIRAIIDARAATDSEWLFPKDDGTRLSANYFRENFFYPVLAAAGIQALPTPEKPAYYVPYSARHTFSNFLKDAPGADKDKAGLMGHEDYRTTKKHYQSVELEALKAIISAI